MTEQSYPVSPRNRVKRVHERGSYDHATVHGILDAAMLAHVSYVLDSQPFCTPTLIWREGEVLYWHGSSASRMIRHLATGVQACVVVSHLDGLVLARSGFNHSANYRSAMCFGTTELVTDPEEKMAQLIAATDRFYPGRSASLRAITPQEVKATAVIRMKIAEASAKIRAKGVGDDEEDGSHPVWAGVIPVATVLGAPVASPALLPGLVRGADLAPYTPDRRLDQALTETQEVYARG
jgi:hypothetical protein